MTNLNRRIVALETANTDQRPIVIYEGDPGPTAPTDRLIVVIKRYCTRNPTEQDEHGQTD